MYNKGMVKKYRKDNIEYMKKSKENNIVREDHVKLLVNGERSITCLYAHGETVKVLMCRSNIVIDSHNTLKGS